MKIKQQYRRRGSECHSKRKFPTIHEARRGIKALLKLEQDNGVEATVERVAYRCPLCRKCHVEAKPKVEALFASRGRR